MKKSKINNREGEINVNKYGTQMKIIKYNNNADIWVEFQDDYKYKTHTSYTAFKSGSVTNLFDKSVYGVGYLGGKKYRCAYNDKAYRMWHGMLERCYNPYTINKYLSYKDCYVSDEFKNFQNFGYWFDKNYYEVDDDRMCLDKDILYKNNKIYSAETCAIVPHRINVLFTRANKIRGDLPVGVQRTRNGHYLASCYILDNGKSVNKTLGTYEFISDAFIAYKTFKESYIKLVAEEYKKYIPQEVYEAMHKYTVEWDD